MRRETLVISNYWHKPAVKVTVRHDADAPTGAIVLETGIDDFVAALLCELPHPIRTLTRKGQEQALREAVSRTLEKVKQASTAAMTAQR